MRTVRGPACHIDCIAGVAFARHEKREGASERRASGVRADACRPGQPVKQMSMRPEPSVFGLRLAIVPACCMLGFVLFLPPGASAQHTRTEQLEQRRAERARESPRGPQTLVEKIVLYVEDRWLQPTALPPRATFYPLMGSVTVEGGLGVGGGYRRSFANDNLRADASALLTPRGYRLGRAALSLPRLVAHRLEIAGVARYRYFPQEDFYGLGADSRQSQRTNYLIEETAVSIQVAWRPSPWLLIASQSGWLEPHIGRGTDSDMPSIEKEFTEATAPGLTRPTNFFEHGTLALVDYRDFPGHARSGGRYAIYISRYDDTRNLGFDFSRVAVQFEQYVPVFDAKRALAFRLTASDLQAEAGSRVPFYYMPGFGGGDSLRGLDDMRLRDASSWIATVEYRWEAMTGVELAVFYDRGGVASRFTSLSIADGYGSYGAGVRLSTGRAIFLRAEASLGGPEGARGVVGFSGPMKLERFLR